MILGAEPVTLRRYSTAETVVDYRPVKPAPGQSTILAGIQHLTGDELLFLPEGQRVRRTFMALTEAEVRTANEAGQIPADELVVGGVTFEVTRVETVRSVIPHYRAWLVEIP